MTKKRATQKRYWIFLRGLARHSKHWGPFVSIFKKNFPDDEIEFLDLRGNGEFHHSPSFISIADNVRDLRARSQFLKEGKRVHLMTISFGSMVGVEWADLFPDDLESLTIVNTSDKGSSNIFERMRPQNYLNLLAVLKKKPGNPLLEKKIIDMVTNKPEEFQDWAKEFATHPPTSRMNFFRQLVAAARYEFPKHKPKTDILILASRGDHFVNPVCSERIAAMWHLKAHYHPKAGHDLALEAPDWICDQIHAWQTAGLKEDLRADLT